MNGIPFDTALEQAGFASQHEFAKYLQTDYGTVNRWRCGRREIPHWIKLLLAQRIALPERKRREVEETIR